MGNQHYIHCLLILSAIIIGFAVLGCSVDGPSSLETDGGSSGDTDADADTDGSADADADADTDADTDADNDVDGDADSDADSDSDTDGSAEEGAFKPIYRNDHMPIFELTIPPQSWEALNNTPTEYQIGSFRYRRSEDPGEDIVIKNVGIRLKGRASFRTLDEKAAFKIRFNEFVSGQFLMGLRRLTLNNMVQDPSMMREVMAYRLFRAAGLTAPLCNHAKVYVNGEYYGLYANVQTLDLSFLEYNYTDPKGNLYDTYNDWYHTDFYPGLEDRFQLETNQKTSDKSDLTKMMSALNYEPWGFVGDAEKVINLNQFLRVGAVQALISDWDGYFGAANNFKTYHEMESDRFVLFTWGLDQTFGIQDMKYDKLYYDIDASESERPNGLVLTQCIQNKECWNRYLDEIGEVLLVWDALPLEDELETLIDHCLDAILKDTRRPHSNNTVTKSMEQLSDFLLLRGDIVRNQLK